MTRGDYPHPTLGTLPQERLIGRRGSRQMVEEGVREGQTRTENEEGHYHRGGRQTTTPMDFQTITSAVTVRSTRATGLDTLTTFSANRPQTVTFDGPISQRTASGPPRNMPTTVSRGGRLISDPLCVLGGSAQPPELSAPLENRPNGYEQRPRVSPEQQACGNWVPPWSILEKGWPRLTQPAVPHIVKEWETTPSTMPVAHIREKGCASQVVFPKTKGKAFPIVKTHHPLLVLLPITNHLDHRTH